MHRSRVHLPDGPRFRVTYSLGASGFSVGDPGLIGPMAAECKNRCVVDRHEYAPKYDKCAHVWPAWSLSCLSLVDQGPDLLEEVVDGISVGLMFETAQEDQIAAALESLNVMDLLVDVGQDGDPGRGLLGGDDLGVDLGGGKGEISPPRQDPL